MIILETCEPHETINMIGRIQFSYDGPNAKVFEFYSYV